MRAAAVILMLTAADALAHPGHGGAAGHLHGLEYLLVALVGGVLGVFFYRR